MTEPEINKLEKQYEEERKAWQEEDAKRWDVDAQLQHQTTLACQDIECALGRLKILQGDLLDTIIADNGGQPRERYLVRMAELNHFMEDMKVTRDRLRKMK